MFHNYSGKAYCHAGHEKSVPGDTNNLVFNTGETGTSNYGALLLVPLIAAIALGNIMVIVLVAIDRRLRSATNCFLSSLAVADMLVALTVMPPSLAMIINSE